MPNQEHHSRLWSTISPMAVGLLAATTTLSSCSPVNRSDEQPPNIVFFYVDDLGWQDTSVPFWTERTHFNDLYRTPNMERLAEAGMLFTQAYASAVCSPSRVSLMTGMNAARHQVTNWTLLRDTSTDRSDDVLDFPLWPVNSLQPVDTIPRSVHATTLPTLLREQGYYTIHVGKAHFGSTETPGALPQNLGFDVNIAGHAAGGLPSFLGERNFGNARPGEHTPPRGVPDLEAYHGQPVHLTDVLTWEALNALDNARQTGQPFYLYLSHYAVHDPLEPHAPFYNNYVPLDLPEAEKRYASMVEGMDNSLGMVLDYLEEAGEAERTILIFKSDNGGLSAYARGGELHTHNYPLNSGKGSAYEGGIRVPMIVSWPGVSRPESRSDIPVIKEDIFPSILEMAGATEFETIQIVDGVSFVPILREQPGAAADRSLFWHYPNRWGAQGPGIGTTSTIRKGDYKLIYWYADQSYELFNLDEDISETVNLADRKPEIVQQLAEELGSWLREAGALRPTFKATGKPVPWPGEF